MRTRAEAMRVQLDEARAEASQQQEMKVQAAMALQQQQEEVVASAALQTRLLAAELAAAEASSAAERQRQRQRIAALEAQLASSQQERPPLPLDPLDPPFTLVTAADRTLCHAFIGSRIIPSPIMSIQPTPDFS